MDLVLISKALNRGSVLFISISSTGVVSLSWDQLTSASRPLVELIVSRAMLNHLAKDKTYRN